MAHLVLKAKWGEQRLPIVLGRRSIYLELSYSTYLLKKKTTFKEYRNIIAKRLFAKVLMQQIKSYILVRVTEAFHFVRGLHCQIGCFVSVVSTEEFLVSGTEASSLSMLELTFLLGISASEAPCAVLPRVSAGRVGGGVQPPRCLCRRRAGAAAAARTGAVSGPHRHRHTKILKRQNKQPAVPGGHPAVPSDKNHLAR